MSPRPFSGSILLPMALAIALAAACDSTAPNSHSAPQRAKPAVVISQVRAERNAFDPAKGETATIRFNLDKNADVALSIYDGRDHRVFERSEKGLAAGDHALTWGGRDRSGQQVPDEAYTYTLTASNAKGSSTHDLTDLTGGRPTAAKDVRWDAATGRVLYYLDKPARVNLRLGLDSGPYLRTVVDWVPRTAGAHAEAWDGKDASGVLNLADHPMLKPAVTAYTLPDNTLFVGAAPDHVRFISESTAPTLRPRAAAAAPKQIGNYAQQSLDTRGDLDASLVLIGNLKRDEEGRWIVKGVVPMRADVAAKDRQRAIERRFEAAFFVDGVFTYENELGYLPMTWNWDTRQLNPGEHVVTFNLRGYEGNFGAATVKVLVEPSAPATAAQAGNGPVQGK